MHCSKALKTSTKQNTKKEYLHKLLFMIKGKSIKSWKEKLEKDMQPKLVEVPHKWARSIGHGIMLIPTPLILDKVIKKIPKGKLITVNGIRKYMAEVYRADISCPLTTGIFLNIAANAAEEDRENGKGKITPYWRVLKEGGALNPKFPGGVKVQATYLKQEGFDICKGKKEDAYFVKDYEAKLASLQ
jgi:hypothetical protein